MTPRATNYADGTLWTAARVDEVRNDYARRLQVPASYIVYQEDGTTYADHCLGTGTNYSGADVATVINSAINALTSGGKVFVKAGTYLINTYIQLKSNVNISGEGWGTILKLADNRPNGVAGDWVNHCIFLHQTGTLQNVTIQDLQLDGNKANQAMGSVTHSIANIYSGASANAIKIFNVFSNTHLRFGIIFDAIGTIYDAKVAFCTVMGSDYNDISFAAGDGELFNCVAIGNTVGGDTGDIGIDTEVWGTGHVHHIVISNNVILEMTGAGGSGGIIGLYGIRLEHNSDYCVVSNNTLYNSHVGISTHDSGYGHQLITCNQIFIKTGAIDTRGITIQDDHNEVTNNFVYGPLGVSSIGIFSDLTASYTYYGQNHLDNLTIGFRLRGDYEQFKLNHLVSCTAPVSIDVANALGPIFQFNEGFVTENRGTATILNGNNSIAVNHGLAGTVDEVFVNGMHAEVESAYTDTFGAAQFTIHKGGAGNVTANRDVNWKAYYTP